MFRTLGIARVDVPHVRHCSRGLLRTFGIFYEHSGLFRDEFHNARVDAPFAECSLAWMTPTFDIARVDVLTLPTVPRGHTSNIFVYRFTNATLYEKMLNSYCTADAARVDCSALFTTFHNISEKNQHFKTFHNVSKHFTTLHNVSQHSTTSLFFHNICGLFTTFLNMSQHF